MGQILKKSEKAADKAMSGFFGNSKKVQSGEGLFDESSRTRPSEPKCNEVKKITDGLWLAPQQEEKKATTADGEIDFEEVSREINELREENPKAYKELREKVKGHMEEANRLADEDENKADEPADVREEQPEGSLK